MIAEPMRPSAPVLVSVIAAVAVALIFWQSGVRTLSGIVGVSPAVRIAIVAPADDTGLALIAEDMDLTIACGAPLNTQVLTDAGGLGADHLTPGTRTDPTRADQPVTVYNGIPGDGEPLNGTSWTTPAAIVTRDDVIVGWGGAEVVFDTWQPAMQEYTIELPALHQCATPAMSPDGLGVYTIWVISSETAYGSTPNAASLDYAAGLQYDVATGAFIYVVD